MPVESSASQVPVDAADVAEYAGDTVVTNAPVSGCLDLSFETMDALYVDLYGEHTYFLDGMVSASALTQAREFAVLMWMVDAGVLDDDEGIIAWQEGMNEGSDDPVDLFSRVEGGALRLRDLREVRATEGEDSRAADTAVQLVKMMYLHSQWPSTAANGYIVGVHEGEGVDYGYVDLVCSSGVTGGEAPVTPAAVVVDGPRSTVLQGGWPVGGVGSVAVPDLTVSIVVPWSSDEEFRAVSSGAGASSGDASSVSPT